VAKGATLWTVAVAVPTVLAQGHDSVGPTVWHYNIVDLGQNERMLATVNVVTSDVCSVSVSRCLSRNR